MKQFKIGDRVKFPTYSGKSWTYGDVVATKKFGLVIVELANGVQIGCNPNDLTKVVRRHNIFRS